MKSQVATSLLRLIRRTRLTALFDQCGRGSVMNSVPHGSPMGPFSNETEPRGGR